MSNIDIRALREAAVRAGGVKWQYMRAMQHSKAYITDDKGSTVVNCTDGDVPAKCAGFLESANPAAVLALLDELEAKDQRIAELEARRVLDSFNIIGENIRTQDNRITSEPMFCVFQKREIVVDEDYDCDRIVWVDEEGCEATERQRMRLELLHDNCRETPDKWRRIAVKDIDDFVTCCFTEQGCKDYLACNGHNLRLPFIYVKSGFRNAEYIGIRNWLAGIGKGE
ncbi:ead/Ea22-like family protein [Enterobacter hormaechei]|nr:ead/Ea22-like family protein [Enterobacter hormaechei]